MSRVINPESAGKDRTRLTKAIVLAVRELAKQSAITDETKDLVAFIALALRTIADGIDVSVAAWEKRDYWVKADRFRMDWEWAHRYSETLRKALLNDDWATVAMTAAQIAQKLMNVDVPVRHKLGEPWVGSWKKLTESKTAG